MTHTNRHPAPAKLDAWRSEADRWIRLATDESRQALQPDGFAAPFDHAQSPDVLQTACVRLLDAIQEIELLRNQIADIAAIVQRVAHTDPDVYNAAKACGQIRALVTAD